MTTADFASGSYNLLQTLNSNRKLEEHGKWESVGLFGHI